MTSIYNTTLQLPATTKKNNHLGNHLVVMSCDAEAEQADSL